MSAKGMLMLIPTGYHDGGDDDPPPPASSAPATGLKRARQEREGQVLCVVQMRTRSWAGEQAALPWAA